MGSSLMMETINLSWRPATKSSNALKAAGYSQEQLNSIGKSFIERFHGQDLSDASSKFTKMVRSSGSGHNVKAKPNAAKTIMKKRADDIANKSEDGEERAKEVKQNEGAMSQADAISWYNARR